MSGVNTGRHMMALMSGPHCLLMDSTKPTTHMIVGAVLSTAVTWGGGDMGVEHVCRVDIA